MKREIISNRRHELHMTQAQLANLIGVKTSKIGTWESGAVQAIPEDMIKKLSEVLEIPEDDIRATNLYPRSTGGPEGPQIGKVEETILKAWKRGDRTVDEVCEITGYPRAIVNRYIQG